MLKKSKSFIIDTRGAINKTTLKTYLEELLPFATNLGLSIAEFPYTITEVSSAEVGEFISVGTSSEFDIDVIIRRGYITEMGYKPILSIVEDFEEIKKHLLDYAIGTNFSEETLCGDTVEFHRGFIKIDNEEGSIILKNEELLELSSKATLIELLS